MLTSTFNWRNWRRCSRPLWPLYFYAHNALKATSLQKLFAQDCSVSGNIQDSQRMFSSVTRGQLTKGNLYYGNTIEFFRISPTMSCSSVTQLWIKCLITETARLQAAQFRLFVAYANKWYVQNNVLDPFSPLHLIPAAYNSIVPLQIRMIFLQQ